jgi:hypothetical protein
MRADPVVTSLGSRLRLESFSGCCGARARLDLMPSVLDGPPVTSGTTNVDFNEPMRAALAGPAVAGPLRRGMGTEEVAVTTVDGFVVERKIPLPGRWLKCFGEVRPLARPMRLVTELARRHRPGVQADPRRRRAAAPLEGAGRRQSAARSASSPPSRPDPAQTGQPSSAVRAGSQDGHRRRLADAARRDHPARGPEEAASTSWPQPATSPPHAATHPVTTAWLWQPARSSGARFINTLS